MKTLTLSLTLLLAALAHTASAQSVYLTGNAVINGNPSYGVAVFNDDWEESGAVRLTVEVYDHNYNLCHVHDSWNDGEDPQDSWLSADFAELHVPVNPDSTGSWMVVAWLEQIYYESPGVPGGYWVLDSTSTMINLPGDDEDDPEMPLDSD